MENDKKLVSVIVPVYNAANYVGNLIRSFLQQTYQNFEMILIDDGSADNSLAVLKEFQQQNPEKICIYTQPNQGIAKTRNRGIQEAHGFYIMFADNDDYVQADYIETMVAEIEKQNADMVICSCRKVDQSGKILYEQILTQEEWSKFRVITPWARIIRKDFVLKNELQFGDFKIGEDIYFTVTAYNLSEKIVVIPYVGYNWVQRKTSVSNTIQKTKIASPFPMLNALIQRNKKLCYMPKEIFEYFIIKLLVWNLYYVCETLDVQSMKIYCREYFLWLEQNFPDYKNNSLIAFNRPHGENLTIRCLVTVFVKVPKMRVAILRAVKFLKGYIRMR